MSRLVNQNVPGVGKRTSMRHAPEYWAAFREICLWENITAGEPILNAVRAHPGGSRTSAVRVFILMYYRTASRGLAKAVANGNAAAYKNGAQPIRVPGN
jgi:predicted DNA-binding ribbon-helix-helix protein